jgi:hypothetical protein
MNDDQILDPVPVHEQLDEAAAQMRALRATVQNRAENGRFAGEQVSEAEDAPPFEDAKTEGEEEYDEEEGEAEAPDEEQAEAVEMPKSWSKDDVELWHNLPPEAQARIAEREGQRDAAISSKFQEVAETRKAYEAKLAEANASRDKWAQDYDLLIADLSLPEPDPRQYGLGTGNYDREAYDIAVIQWKEGSKQLEGLKQQRETIRAQQQQEEMQNWTERKTAIDAEFVPKLVALMPELQDGAKAEAAMRDLVSWGVSQGLSPETFSPDNQPFITAAELRLLALAKKAAEAEGTAQRVPPKKQPAIRPGVSTPRSAQKTVAKQKAFSALQETGTLEAAAAAMRAARR